MIVKIKCFSVELQNSKKQKKRFKSYCTSPDDYFWPQENEWDKLGLKIENKSNIEKTSSSLCQSLLTLILSNTPVSTESRHLSVITCSSSVAICSAHNMIWILRYNCSVVTQYVKWFIFRGANTPYWASWSAHTVCASPIVYCVGFF